MGNIVNSTVAIREEKPMDSRDVHYVNSQAFGRPDEGRLIERLRKDGDTLLSLIATYQNKVIGHVLFSPVIIKSNTNSMTGAALGPIAVLPDFQRQGIGGILIRTGLSKLRQAGQPYCLVLGFADYYPRFGFVPSHHYGIKCQWSVPREAFMVLELKPGVLDTVTGTAHYRPAFNNV